MTGLAQHSDEELLQLIVTGSETAFTELYNRFHNKLFNFAFQLSGSREEAKDLVQDVFSKIWERRALFEDKAQFNFASYLFAMVRNYAVDHLRRFSKQIKILHELEPATAQHSAEEWMNYKELQSKIQSSINQLPPRQKEIFILHREKGLKYSEIASRLGLSKSTVENHFCRAIEKLRKNFEVEYELFMLAPFLLLCFF